MTDLATLAIKVDSSEAGKAATDLDKLTAAGKRSNVTVEQAERYMRKASIVLGDMAQAEKTAAAEAQRLASASAGAGQAASKMARDAQNAAAGIKQVGGMSNAAAFAARNLGYQLSDVVTQLASGTPPMRVFAQQGFQIVDALSMMRAEASKTGQSVTGMLVGSLGKANPAILAAVAALGGMAAALKVVQDDLNETGKTSLSYSDVALGAFDAVRAFTVDKLGPAFEWLADVAGTVWGYIAAEAKRQANFMIGVMVAVPNTIYAAFTTLPQAIAELFVNMANGAIKAIEGLVNKAIGGLNSFAGMVNGLLGTSIGGVGKVSFGRIENTFAGAGSRAGAAMGKALTSSFGDYVGKAEAYIRPFAEARARMGDAAEKAGRVAGARGGKAGGRAAGEAMADGWAKTLGELQKDTAGSIVGILKQGDESLNALLKASDEGLSKLLQGIGQVSEQQGDWNTELERTLDLLGQLGSRGDTIGSILMAFQGLKTGDFSGVRGSAGVLLNTIGNIQWNGTKDGERYIYKLGEEIFGALDKVFGGGGKFEQTMNNLFAGAGTGAAIGGILGGGKGGQLGGTLGGAAGQALGSAFSSAFGKLASAAGPIGAIAGAILGNVLGGIVSGTKRGGATIGVGGVSGTWGNSSSRIDAASGIGRNAVDALSQLASVLGVNLGSFSSSVSVRKNDLRFDPTGSGISKTSKGAISFGQDEEALLKAVIKDAISDGAFEGLSEGFKAYLTSGDVEKRLQDVLDIKAIQNEAASLRDPQGFALAELDKQFARLREIATATGEGLADIEYVYGQRRKDILEQLGTDTVQLEKDRKALLIQIADLEGRSTEALAMAREMEKASVDESLRPLYDRIYALQDEATAAAKAAEIAAEAKRIADERYSLETQLLQLLGKTDELRARERETIGAANRDVFDHIEALKAEQAALAEVARLTQERADRIRANAQEDFALQMRLAAAGGGDITKLQRENELRQASSDLVRQRLLEIYAIEDLTAVTNKAAEDAKRIADERFGLEGRLLQLQGDTAALRQRELDTLDPANRALLQMIFNLEDTQAAAEAAAKAAEELAAKNKAIADEIGGLNRQWLELTGQTAELRKLDLAALMSNEARALQQQIWDYSDALEAQKKAQEAAAAAAEEYNRRLDEARNNLSAAYERESSALQQTIDKFRDFAQSIREFREGLTGGSAAGAQSQFRKTLAMAQFGNEAALGRFTGDAQNYLDSARNSAGSLVEFQRVVAEVARGANLAESGASGVASEAQKQLDIMTEVVDRLGLLRDDVQSFDEAVTAYNKLLAEDAIPAFTNTVGAGLVAVQEELVVSRDEAKRASDKGQVALETAAIALGRVERLLARVIIDDSVNVSSLDGVTVTGTVTVGNTSANPVPVDTTP